MLIGLDRGEEAIGELDRALDLDPKMAPAHGTLGMCKRFLGRPEESEGHARKALQLSPRDPQAGTWYFQIGGAALQLGQFDKAVTWIRRSVEADRRGIALFFLASALAHQGAISEAKAAAADGLASHPDFKIRG